MGLEHILTVRGEISFDILVNMHAGLSQQFWLFLSGEVRRSGINSTVSPELVFSGHGHLCRKIFYDEGGRCHI